MDQTSSVNADPVSSNGILTICRSFVGFWMLGICNNFAYVVMLSAAHDILKQQENHNSTMPTPTTGLYVPEGEKNSSIYDCNPFSTATVLLADILPTLLIKMVAPFFIHKVPYGFRVLLCVATAVASFLVVSFSTMVGISILGVVFASISSGLGELSFLSLTVFFDRSVVGGWSSGTGGAGVAGALLYSALTQVGLTPRITLLIMLIVPTVMLVSYFFLLVFPHTFHQWQTMEVGQEVSALGQNAQERRHLMPENADDDEENDEEEKVSGILTFKEQRLVLKGLLRFIIPLGVVYFAEYFINQGLLELLFFPGFPLSHPQQYRWYQTLYQVGVFISRSSLCCVKIKKVWILSVLQCLNAVLLCFAVYYQFLPSAYVVFLIVGFEGLLGGAAYVNTFYSISIEMGDREREYAMAAASVGDSLGIALSGLTAIPLHNYFCSL